MPVTRWNDLFELSELQMKVMHFVQKWARDKKKPVPHSVILKAMKKKGTNEPSTYDAIQKLLKTNYLRRAIMVSNKTYYVQLKSIK